MSSDLFQALANNTEVDGYRIDKVIGSGGFGITYLGHDLGLNKSVAIKEYLPRDLAVRVDNQSVRAASSSDKDDFTWGLQRFLDEARVLARFDHKNIVRVHRFFQMHGTAYIVMEYVDGETLSSLLQREHTLSCQHLLSILDPLLSGLEIVHKGDVLHRDIKPGNIIIRDSGVPVLIDFGAARQAVGARSRSVTAIVTPGYAPIEQYSTRGRQGPWTDIYALGAICYRAMTGETPIDAPERVRRDPLVPLSKQSIPEGYPGFFPGAVDRALSVDEEERPGSIGEWRDMLEGRGEAGAVSAPTADERAKTRLLPRDSRPAASAGQPQAPSGFKPSRGLVFGGIGAVAVTGLVMTLISFGGRGPTPQPDRSPDIPEQNTITPELAAAWARVQTLNTAEAYEDFLGTWPDSPYADDAKAAMGRLGTEADDAAFAQAQSRDLVRSYGQYVQDYPAGRHMDKADDGAWGSAGRQNTANAYQAYLTDFPDGKYIEDARAAIAEAARQEAERQEAKRQEAERQEAERQKQARCRAWNSDAFFETASAGDVRACLRAGANPEAQDKTGDTPLHWAAKRGHAGAIAALLEAGADPKAREDLSGLTPLHIAAIHGHAGAIAALLEAGADPRARDNRGETPLHNAGSANVTAALLEAGADLEARDKGGGTPLRGAAFNDRAGVITALLEAGADLEARDKNGATPLHIAASYSRVGVITALLEAGADPDARDFNDRTPLFWSDTPDAIAALLEAGADPRARDKYDKTPLHEANSADAIAALLEAGADPGARDQFGNTPLHEARKPDVIAALVEAGADPRARDKIGNTPLHFAASRGGHVDVIAALVEAGADPRARDNNGWTPLHEARKPDVIAALVEAGADPGAREEDGETPLHIVARYRGNADLIAALLEAGADPGARDDEGETPFDVIPSDSPLIGTQAWRRLQQAR